MFIAKEPSLLQNAWKETADDENDKANDEHHYCLSVTALPLLEDDTPEIAERDIQRHQDAEGKGSEDRTFGEEAFSQAQPKELTVPKHTCQ